MAASLPINRQNCSNVTNKIRHAAQTLLLKICKLRGCPVLGSQYKAEASLHCIGL